MIFRVSEVELKSAVISATSRSNANNGGPYSEDSKEIAF